MSLRMPRAGRWKRCSSVPCRLGMIEFPVAACVAFLFLLAQPAGAAMLENLLAEFRQSTDQDRKLEILIAVSKHGKPALDFLQSQGLGPPSPIRDKAITLLGEVNPPALNALVKIANEGPKGARIRALETLSNLGEVASTVVESMVPLLVHDESQTRLHTIRMLGNCGPKGYPAIPGLLEVMRFGSAEEFTEARLALLKMTHLTLTMASDVNQVMIKHYLGEIKDPRKGLEELSKSKSASIRREAVRQVANLGFSAKVALPALQKLLQDKAPDVSQEAFAAIQKLMP